MNTETIQAAIDVAFNTVDAMPVPVGAVGEGFRVGKEFSLDVLRSAPEDASVSKYWSSANYKVKEFVYMALSEAGKIKEKRVLVAIDG